MRTITKEQRNNSRDIQFKALINKGATRTTYKSLDIFTWSDEVSHFIKAFKGTAANHYIFERYRQIEARDKRVQQAKDGEDRRETWKAEQKEQNKGKSSTHAAAASAIRTELNNSFKGFKFSVTSDSFSGGNSVRIHWIDGPTTREVEQITGRYQYGHFNGMEDIYEYSNNIDNLPQVKYVNEGRTMSDKVKHFITDELTKLWGSERSAYEIERELYQIFSASSLPPDAELTGINTDAQDWKLTYKQPQQETRPKPTTTAKGEIKVINYSEKAIAVIGEGTREIKEELKSLGGKFNKYLSCGPGWIFSKKQTENVVNYLKSLKNTQEDIMTELKEEVKQLPPPQEPEVIINDNDIIPVPPTNTLKLDSFTILWHEGKQNPNFENVTFTDWNEVQKAFFTIWSHNEKGQDGGYTKVKCSIKLEGKEPEVCRIDITSRINNGDFNPSYENIVPYIINNLYEPEEIITPKQPSEQAPQLFDNLKDIQTAANNGQMISFSNLSNLINNKANV